VQVAIVSSAFWVLLPSFEVGEGVVVVRWWVRCCGMGGAALVGFVV
jgi:hypothetical protein